MSKFSQPSVTITDKRTLRQKLRLIGEAGGNCWVRLSSEDHSLPPQTRSRFPNLQEEYLPGANVSVAITEPSEEEAGSWAIAFDKFAANRGIRQVLAWRIGYVLLAVPTPEEITLQVDSYGTLFNLAATEEPLEEIMRRGSFALDKPTNVALDSRCAPAPLEAPEVRILSDGFAVMALEVCRDVMWE